MTSTAPKMPVFPVRNVILDAAEKRFLYYGYNKTTMAEIAADVEMSAANIYRYFQNKQELAVCCCERRMGKRLSALEKIVQQRGLRTRDKLWHYVLTLIKDSHTLASKDSRAGELVDNITAERPDLLRTHNSVHYTLISQIVQEGIQNKELKPIDAEQYAPAIHSSFALFENPMFVGLYTESELKDRALKLVELLLEGLLLNRFITLEKDTSQKC
jgi:AcrR family transcriptional regulator